MDVEVEEERGSSVSRFRREGTSMMSPKPKSSVSQAISPVLCVLSVCVWLVRWFGAHTDE